MILACTLLAETTTSHVHPTTNDLGQIDWHIVNDDNDYDYVKMGKSSTEMYNSKSAWLGDEENSKQTSRIESSSASPVPKPPVTVYTANGDYYNRPEDRESTTDAEAARNFLLALLQYYNAKNGEITDREKTIMDEAPENKQPASRKHKTTVDTHNDAKPSFSRSHKLNWRHKSDDDEVDKGVTFTSTVPMKINSVDASTNDLYFDYLPLERVSVSSETRPADYERPTLYEVQLSSEENITPETYNTLDSEELDTDNTDWYSSKSPSIGTGLLISPVYTKTKVMSSSSDNFYSTDLIDDDSSSIDEFSDWTKSDGTLGYPFSQTIGSPGDTQSDDSVVLYIIQKTEGLSIVTDEYSAESPSDITDLSPANTAYVTNPSRTSLELTGDDNSAESTTNRPGGEYFPPFMSYTHEEDDTLSFADDNILSPLNESPDTDSGSIRY